MKSIALSLSVILALNSTAFAQVSQTQEASEARQVELLNLAKSNPREALKKMSKEELVQVQQELRTLILGLKYDFDKAEAQDGDRLGYKIRKWGAISTGTLIVLTIGGALAREYTYKGPAVDSDSVAILIFGSMLTVGAIAATAGGQVMVWLTPSEAKKVQNKIDLLVKLSNSIDQNLK